MEKLYELEMTRNNVTPRAFYGMVRRALLKKGGVELESWVGTDGFEQWKKPCDEVDAHSTENETICKKPFDFQIAAKDAYNVILEFQFDDDERGSGYAYICEYEQAEQPAPETATPDAQEAANDEPETPDEQAATDSEQEETKMTLEKLYALTLNNLDANDGDIVGVTIYTDDGDTAEDFNDVRDVINRYGNREVEPINIGDVTAAFTEPSVRGEIHVALVEKETVVGNPAPEFNYDFLSGRYAIFEYADGVFSNEYETDDLKEARERLKEEWDGSLESGAFAIFDRDARQYIQIRAASKGRKAFKAENERLAAKAVSQTESDSAAAGQPAPQEAANEQEVNKMQKSIGFGVVTHRSGRKSFFSTLPDGGVVEHNTFSSTGVCFVKLMAECGFTLLHHDESMDEVHVGLSKKEQLRRSHKVG